MKKTHIALCLLCCWTGGCTAATTGGTGVEVNDQVSSADASPDTRGSTGNSLYEVVETLPGGGQKRLADYKGQVLLIVNIALECGTTPQLAAIEKLYTEQAPHGLMVLGFPSGQFTGEDVSDPSAVRHACQKRFGVTFPLFAPGAVAGPQIRGVFRHLTTQGPAETRGPIVFNFEKFLVDRRGALRYRFGSFTPASGTKMERAINELLKEEG